PCRGRAVQDDDGYRLGTRAVSWQLLARSAQRAGAGSVCSDAFVDRLYPSRYSACLAVTGATRSEALPNIPTVGESVQGYEAIGWYGLGAPKDTPAAIIDKLNNEINAILADPTMKARLFALGAEPMPMTSAAFGKFMSDEADKWGKVIKFAGIKPD